MGVESRVRYPFRTMAAALAVGFLVPLFLPAPAAAQYFGSNKVQYEEFDFQVLATEHFDIYYYDQEEPIIQEIGRMAERWYARIARVLDHQLGGRQPLIIYAAHPHFEQTNAIPGRIGEGTGGVTEALKRRIVLPVAGPLAETDHVLGHEIVHAFQYDMTGRSGGVGFQAPAALGLPLWFIEGMAEYLSIGPVDPFTAMWMRDAARPDGDFPSISDLSDAREYFPYRFGHALWAYIGGRWGDEAVGLALKAAGRTGNAIGALAAVLRINPDSLSADWRNATRSLYAEVEGETYPPGREAELLVSEETGGGTLNIGPALSPDGSRVVFLSEKDLFSVDVYLADAETGEIRRKVTETAVDPHFESLQFINSAGAWSTDGERFALAGVTEGQPTITVIDVESGDRLQEVVIDSLGEAYGPTWSPDGRSIAFSGLQGGHLDLFAVDMETKEVRRLTHDLYADLQPVWSPDGRSIAFVTDRFTSDLRNLAFGDYRLALFDVTTNEIRPLPAFGNGKQINPQWSADGESLYFITNVSGVPNVYRYRLSDGALFQITDLVTGVSGITALSPVLSSAADASRLVYTVYEDGEHNLYTIDDPEKMAGEPVSVIAGVSPAVLPPRDRGTGLVAALLSERELGLADTLTFERHDYHAGLSLDYVSQPTLAVGASQFGAAVGGGIALLFSDMLGNHVLSSVLQVSSEGGDILKSSAAVVGYEDRSDRWNWGFIGGQVPLVLRFFAQGVTTAPNGQPAQFIDIGRIWQIQRQVGASVAYPFSRALRVEFSASFQNIDFAGEVERRFFDASGQQFADETLPFLRFDTIPSLNMGTGSAALVYDNSLFGGTGPILGQRYRIEASPTFGSLNYVAGLFDYRRYVMPVRPFTLAGRFLHFGRYGSGGEDERLQDLFVGYPSLIRGYDFGSFEDPSECGQALFEDGTCPVLDQLFGSRIAVVNLEARLPFLGVLGVIPSAGAPPVTLIAFYDAGLAWTSDIDPDLWFVEGVREPVTSYGAGLRVNLFGLLIGEVDYVHPNDRPIKGWYWQFSLTPGF